MPGIELTGRPVVVGPWSAVVTQPMNQPATRPRGPTWSTTSARPTPPRTKSQWSHERPKSPSRSQRHEVRIGGPSVVRWPTGFMRASHVLFEEPGAWHPPGPSRPAAPTGTAAPALKASYKKMQAWWHYTAKLLRAAREQSHSDCLRRQPGRSAQGWMWLLCRSLGRIPAGGGHGSSLHVAG